MTGHCTLKKHMFNIGKIDSSECRLCLEMDESARHVFCECMAVARIRLEVVVNPSVLREADLKKIIEFFRKLEKGFLRK